MNTQQEDILAIENVKVKPPPRLPKCEYDKIEIDRRNAPTQNKQEPR